MAKNWVGASSLWAGEGWGRGKDRMGAGPDRAEVVLRLAGEEAGRPFDLASGRLLRATLLRIGQQDPAASPRPDGAVPGAASDRGDVQLNGTAPGPAVGRGHRDATEHVLLLNLHHIAGDGWSLGVLFHEIGKLYEAFSGGAESPLAPLPVQYADYAVWQRKWLSDETLEKQLAYWSRRLGDAPPALELPTDRPRPPV